MEYSDVYKRQGMRRVATNGTLAGYFSNFKYPVAGKTGTAERACLLYTSRCV